MSTQPGDEDWVLLSDGRRVHLPSLPPQDDGAAAEGNAGVVDDKGFHLLEKPRSAWGSTAGAGSDFFHVYRKQRAREQLRQENMDKEWTAKEEAAEFQARRAARIQATLAKQAKKSEKRSRRKLNKAIKKAQQRQGSDKKDSSTMGDEVAEASPVKAEVIQMTQAMTVHDEE